MWFGSAKAGDSGRPPLGPLGPIVAGTIGVNYRCQLSISTFARGPSQSRRLLYNGEGSWGQRRDELLKGRGPGQGPSGAPKGGGRRGPQNGLRGPVGPLWASVGGFVPGRRSDSPKGRFGALVGLSGRRGFPIIGPRVGGGCGGTLGKVAGLNGSKKLYT